MCAWQTNNISSPRPNSGRLKNSNVLLVSFFSLFILTFSKSYVWCFQCKHTHDSCATATVRYHCWTRYWWRFAYAMPCAYFASLHYIEWVAQRAIVEWRTIQKYARQVNRMEKKTTTTQAHTYTHTTHSQMNCALFGFGLEKLCSK